MDLLQSVSMEWMLSQFQNYILTKNVQVANARIAPEKFVRNYFRTLYKYLVSTNLRDCFALFIAWNNAKCTFCLRSRALAIRLLIFLFLSGLEVAAREIRLHRKKKSVFVFIVNDDDSVLNKDAK